ncbi:hypothetical protein [Paenibacillus sp.]|jgi:hypothetical protein|uniref:hypothetical protein n=1 Tax=Paenibacillus sp. TaxID=58172 RepID=UPI0028307FE9|nr:hypothetical protein [Paenibacillus sp.]MDR0269265.1 hypothetical protein [Paenibacillus sp.]
MKNNVVVEFNDLGYLIHSVSFPGAYVRGQTKHEAMSKFPIEIEMYCKWASLHVPDNFETIIVQEKESDLNICDADSDVIFDMERYPISGQEYQILKQLCIKSAHDFLTMYESIPNKNISSLDNRETFYGQVPQTANEMYVHTNNVTSYYIGEIHIPIDNNGDILENRNNALLAVETEEGFLTNQVHKGSYDEYWSLKKVLRRFIWHDRIHAKAMYRMATKIWDKGTIANPFFF